MGTVGIPEMMAVVVIALLLFGPDKLPELGRTLGRAMQQFRRAKEEFRNSFETHMRELEREVNLAQMQKTLPPTPSYPDYSSNGYSYPYEQAVSTPPAVETHVPPALPAPDAQPIAPNGTAAPAVNGTVARGSSVRTAPEVAPAEVEGPAGSPHNQ